MSDRVVAIGLKIPDNTAYTAFATLRRLGIIVARVERYDLLHFRSADGLTDASLRQRVERDETLFNPNKHRLTILDGTQPRSGEVWIETLGGAPAPADTAGRYVGWRLFERCHEPATREVVAAAVQALLCNPAIERPIYSRPCPRHNFVIQSK